MSSEPDHFYVEKRRGNTRDYWVVVCKPGDENREAYTASTEIAPENGHIANEIARAKNEEARRGRGY